MNNSEPVELPVETKQEAVPPNAPLNSEKLAELRSKVEDLLINGAEW